MLQLEALARQARALADNSLAYPQTMTSAESEVARQMQICNACRYCEGFCAVFPAMTRRIEFGKADVHFLANLCHNCGACLHACQYAPPHEFAVNVPKAMAKVRGQTYADYAWPPGFGRLYQRNGLTVALALAAGLSAFLLMSLVRNGTVWGQPGTGSFYALFPHTLLLALFAPVFLWAVVAIALGVRRFWRDVHLATSGAATCTAAVAEAAHSVAILRYLDGGHGEGCHNEDDAWTHARRRAHHLTMYGFLLCFASTCVATVYHYLFGWAAPYDMPSLPKLLGVPGGIALLVGSLGLLRLHWKRHPDHGDPQQKPMDRGFIALLALTSASGLALWLGRSTSALPPLLAVHLGAVMALFATLPYGKFVHGVFRAAALLRHAVEKRQPNSIGLGAD